MQLQLLLIPLFLMQNGFVVCFLETCPNRPAPDNGAYVGGIRATWFSGDLARFTCSPGYELFGSASSRCRSTRSWSSDVPTCRR